MQKRTFDPIVLAIWTDTYGDYSKVKFYLKSYVKNSEITKFHSAISLFPFHEVKLTMFQRHMVEDRIACPVCNSMAQINPWHVGGK